MKINGEECELVTDFATLRAGMIVYIKPCRVCGVIRRMMLTRLTLHLVLRKDGNTEELAWEALPQCHKKVCIPASSVGCEIIYRVVDPLLAQTTTRKREAVRG